MSTEFNPTTGATEDHGGIASSDGQGNVQVQPSGVKQEGTPVDAALGDRPEWYPEGVNTPEELEAWHRKTFDDPAADKEAGLEAKAPEAGDKEKPAADTRTDDEIKANLKAAGGLYADPRYEPFALEVARKGELAPESITAAAAAFGVSEDAVKNFVQSQKDAAELQSLKGQNEQTAANQAIATAIVKVIPTEGHYEQMVADAPKFLSAQEMADYNEAMDTGKTNIVGALLQNYYARWLAEGNGPRREITDKGASPAARQGAQAATEPFASMAEQTSAMGSRRYANDPGYRASIDARVAVSGPFRR